MEREREMEKEKKLENQANLLQTRKIPLVIKTHYCLSADNRVRISKDIKSFGH